MPKDRFSGILVTWGAKTIGIIFEARAYISYNLKFVY
jgi:hypothetical protein